LCQPENENTITEYNETLEDSQNKLLEKLNSKEITQSEYDKKISEITDISTLPKCSEFKVSSGEYEGLWTNLFIKPLAWLILKIGTFVNNYGLAIIIITFLIRLVLYPITMKTAKQSEEMQKAKPEKTRLKRNTKTETIKKA
jgi:membrane protein insertase Oxa1/YidC/SpoIIIJ